MAVYFLDSSALVKRYISETGSTWILGLFAPALNNEIFVAAVTGVEIVAAMAAHSDCPPVAVGAGIARRARGGNLSVTDATAVCSQFRGDLQTITNLSKSQRASLVLGLRGYDAIQLAAGCAVNALCIANRLPPVIFVSADDELNVAASSESLVIENPNNQP